MTKFINLESYIECCEYAYLFAEDPNKLIPHVDKLPIAYRDFCNRNLSHSFLSIPTVATNQPTSLIPRTHQLAQQCRNIGLQLAGNSLEKIFIIREANSIVSGNIGSRYLYANVYRYWNYAQQLQQFTSSQKPLVIYDLDSFTPAQITPITFENRSNAPYPIPIIDTRSLKEDNTLKLSQSYEEIYDTICLEIAHHIGQDLKLNSQDVLEVSKYIKKNNLFQNIDFTSISNIPLILDINEHYYLYDLSQEILARIIYPNLPIAELKQIIKNNPHCNFVLLSSFNNLSSIKNILQQSFQDNLFITDKAVHNFHEIWQQKLENQFPLFGQHLDRISFFVTRAGEKIEISLPQKTCYEGQQEEILYGEYPKGGKLEQNFSLKTPNVTLPFRINENLFLENDIEQAYQIENQYFEETPELNIKIRFRIKPGLIPKLEVIDVNERILNSRLIDRNQVQISNTLGFIPMMQILQSREEKSAQGLKSLFDSGFNHDLQYFLEFISTNWKLVSSIELAERISVFRSMQKDKLLPIIFINDVQNLADIYQGYSFAEKLLENVFIKIAPNKKNTTDVYQLMNKAHSDLLLILGDSYALTSSTNLDFIFDVIELSKAKGLITNWDNRLRTIAKISCSRNRQNLYLSLFDRFTDYRKNKFYKTDEYIWGYARLLLWYVDINDSLLFKDYEQHFTILLNYCLTLNAKTPHQRSYLRDALIALIYLLTFREINPQFVERGSASYTQSKKLCDRLNSTPILSRKANIETPLNQFFEHLLDGSATQEEVDDMIRID
jgi:hypothetical protein